jgi:hypothetical protein
MGIVFFCQSCGARFEVDLRMAGKRGHCKKCGQVMTIPRTEEIASMSAIPALAMAGGGASPAAAGPAGGASIQSALRAGISNINLAPLTVDRMSVGPMLFGRKKPAKPSPLDDAEDSKPYALAKPVRESRGAVRSHDNVVLRAWRGQLSWVNRVFRWINETAYLISVPFIMMLLLGVMVRNWPMAVLGAAVVVVLNIGRLVAGGAGLVVIPLRDGLHWKKLKKPLQRVAEPALTIGLVVLAFLFIPFLSTGKPSTKGVAGRINAGLEAMEKRALGELAADKEVEQAQKQR